VLYHLSSFALGIFLIGCHVNAWESLNHDTPIFASCMAGMTGIHHHAQNLLIEIRSYELFARAGLEP
jgi:hypothetical protein